jgi:hypothetical protein
MNSDEKRGVERFRRVKDEEIQVDEKLKDNSFEARVSVHYQTFLFSNINSTLHLLSSYNYVKREREKS